jgi:UDP-glucose:(heptosyl)LPS alpha-1,3-glucosyltransferase
MLHCPMMTRRPRIAVVIPKYGVVGGAERFAAEVTSRLAASSDYEFHVFAQQWATADDSPVTFHRIPRRPFPRSLRPWAFARHVARALESGNFDLVHSHDRIFAADIVSLHCTPHRAWVKDILHKRMSLFDRSTIAVETRLLRQARSTTFLPVSSLTMDMFRREYPESSGRWAIVPPGVDYERFSSPDRDQCRQEIRDRHGIPRGAFLVLFAGMNFQLKGLDAIMESVALARRQRPAAGIHLLVVGRGQTGKYRAKARALEMDDAVNFAGEVTEGIEDYYRASDAFMMLSAFDTFGMVVLEAMAAGLPVIIGPQVGAKDLVHQGENGFVLQNRNDSAAAADCLVGLTVWEHRERLAANTAATAAGSDWSFLTEKIRGYYTTSIRDARAY